MIKLKSLFRKQKYRDSPKLQYASSNCLNQQDTDIPNDGESIQNSNSANNNVINHDFEDYSRSDEVTYLEVS